MLITDIVMIKMEVERQCFDFTSAHCIEKMSPVCMVMWELILYFICVGRNYNYQDRGCIRIAV